MEVTSKEEEVLAIPRAQPKKVVYPNPCTQKQWALEPKAEIEKQFQAHRELKDDIRTFARATANQNILGQVVQVEVLVKVKGLLETMCHLHTTLLHTPATTTNRDSWQLVNGSNDTHGE